MRNKDQGRHSSLWAVLLLFFCSAAVGAEWWFRPPNNPIPDSSYAEWSAYCEEYPSQCNGTSYDTAWRSDLDVQWEIMQPGDVFHICGIHEGTVHDRHLTPNIRDITITGDCRPGEDGVLIGGVKFWNAEDWSARDGIGSYSTYFPDNFSPKSQLLEGDYPDLVRLEKAYAPPDGTWECGTYYADTEGDRLYYLPTGCGSPKPVHLAGNYWIEPSIGANNLVIEHLRFYAAGVRVLKPDPPALTISGLTIRENYFQWAQTAVRAYGVSDALIENNEITNCSNGIIHLGNGFPEGDTAGDRWTVRYNWIHDCEQHGYYRSSPQDQADDHAIGFQGGDGHLVEYNLVDGIAGSGVTIYKSEDLRVRDNIIRYNEVRNVRDYTDPDSLNAVGSFIQGCYDLHGAASLDPEWVQNNLWYGNLCVNAQQAGFRMSCPDNSKSNACTIENNTIKHARWGLRVMENNTLTPQVRFNNNKLFMSSEHILWFNGNSASVDRHSEIISENTFLWDEPGMFAIGKGTGKKVYDYAEFSKVYDGVLNANKVHMIKGRKKK